MHARRLYLLEKASLNTVCFLSCRFRFEVFFVRICRRPCFVRMSFPVPVFLKRFRIAFLVFILGTFILRFTTYECCSCSPLHRILLLLAQWGEHQTKVPTHLLWRRFGLRDIAKFLSDSKSNLLTQFLVSHLSSTKHTGNAHFVPFLYKLSGPFDLHLKIMLVNVRFDLYFFQLGLVLCFLTFPLFFCHLVAELSIIYNFANRWFRIRRNLNEVKPILFCLCLRLFYCYNAYLLPIFPYQSNLWSAYFSVNSQMISSYSSQTATILNNSFFCDRSFSLSSKTCSTICCMLGKTECTIL